jgi:hypothetical protein
MIPHLKSTRANFWRVAVFVCPLRPDDVIVQVETCRRDVNDKLLFLIDFVICCIKYCNAICSFNCYEQPTDPSRNIRPIAVHVKLSLYWTDRLSLSAKNATANTDADTVTSHVVYCQLVTSLIKIKKSSGYVWLNGKPQHHNYFPTAEAAPHWASLRHPHPVGLLRTSDQTDAEISTRQNTTLKRDRLPCAYGGIRTCNSNKRVAAETLLKPRGHWDRLSGINTTINLH